MVVRVQRQRVGCDDDLGHAAKTKVCILRKLEWKQCQYVVFNIKTHCPTQHHGISEHRIQATT